MQPKKVCLLVLIMMLGLLTAGAVGCTLPSNSVTYAVNPVSQRETLAQVSTLDALMAGVYDGSLSCRQLKGYGDFGIGTVEALDGELIELDGKFYHVRSDGVAYAVADSMRVPFANVTFFDRDYEGKVTSGINFSGLEDFLDGIIPSDNIFCAIKFEGSFNYMKTRSVPKQARPYPPLAEVVKHQSVFEFNNVAGTIVGFRCPPYVKGVNMPGYHFHFLTADHKAGGHVLDLNTGNSLVSLDYTSEFFMILPETSSDFYNIDLSGDQQRDIQKVEK